MKVNTISKQDKDQEKTLSKWDNAIQDAEKGIKRLERAIRICREKRAAGEPWPGSVPKESQIL
jgi:hypothetical protein